MSGGELDHFTVAANGSTNNRPLASGRCNKQRLKSFMVRVTWTAMQSELRFAAAHQHTRHVPLYKFDVGEIDLSGTLACAQLFLNL